jgi:hypothetical protein
MPVMAVYKIREENRMDKNQKKDAVPLRDYIDNLADEINREKGEPAVKPWTQRGVMLPQDKMIIQSTVDHQYAASRIFVTGVAHEDYLGELGVKHLININEVYYKAGDEPLFVETKNDTICMTRFDPKSVWTYFHPDTLAMLLNDEAERLGVEFDPWNMDHFDFYQSLIAQIQAKAGGPAIPIPKEVSLESFYQSVYLSCLLLFGKPGYMNVPIAEHFADVKAADFLRTAVLYRLNTIIENKHDRLFRQYEKIKALTNPEIEFIVDIYESEKDKLVEVVKTGKEGKK